MTEEEAKAKWCPFARDSSTAGNRVRYGDGATSVDPQYAVEAAGEFPCIASACMAWRTVKFDAGADKIAAIKEHRRVHGSDLLTAKNAVEAQWSPGGVQGFCGLAGEPK